MAQENKKPGWGIIIGVAVVLTIFGILSYQLWQKNEASDNFINKQIDENCLLKPDPGPCKARFPSFYFETDSQKCMEFVWGGCEGTRPFETLDECQLTCEGEVAEKSDLQSWCEAGGGTWLEEYTECEYLAEATCVEMGGVFNECDSACRHATEPVACTMNCVQTCSF